MCFKLNFQCCYKQETLSFLPYWYLKLFGFLLFFFQGWSISQLQVRIPLVTSTFEELWIFFHSFILVMMTFFFFVVLKFIRRNTVVYYRVSLPPSIDAIGYTLKEKIANRQNYATFYLFLWCHCWDIVHPWLHILPIIGLESWYYFCRLFLGTYKFLLNSNVSMNRMIYIVLWWLFYFCFPLSSILIFMMFFCQQQFRYINQWLQRQMWILCFVLFKFVMLYTDQKVQLNCYVQCMMV